MPAIWAAEWSAEGPDPALPGDVDGSGRRLPDQLAPLGDDRRSARLGLCGDHAERLLPARRTQDRQGATHELPEARARERFMNSDSRQAASWVDELRGVLGIVGVSVEVYTHLRRLSDFDGLRGTLFGTEPPRE